MLGLAAALGVAVITHARLLAETAEAAEAVVHLHRRVILALAGQLASAPFQINADHVVHAERAHGETKALQCGIDLMRISPFEQQHARLADIGVQHAVADKTVAVTRHHADLADTLTQGQCHVQYRRRGFGATHDFQQFHDVRRAEEVQAEHVLRAFGHGGNGVDIQRRGVTGENGAWLQGGVERAENLLLEFQVLVHRFDHQIGICQRGIVAHRCDASQSRVRLLGADPPQFEVVGIGLGHHLHGLLEHLRVVVQPQHLNAGVGQAHDDTAPHGARADHGGLSNLECLAHAHSSD